MSLSRSGNVIRWNQYQFVQMPKPLSPQEGTPALAEESDARPMIGPEDGSRPGLVTSALTESLLAQARTEADRILAEALKQGQSLREQAETEGRRLGLEAGQIEAKKAIEAQFKEEIERIQQVLEATRTERNRILARSESELVELSLAIARRIIGDAVARDIEVLLHMAHQAVAQLGQSGPFQLHVNAEDFQRLTDYWADENAPEWELVVDDRVAPGGCIVTSGAGMLDARPETQLSLIQRSFKSLQ